MFFVINALKCLNLHKLNVRIVGRKRLLLLHVDKIEYVHFSKAAYAQQHSWSISETGTETHRSWSFKGNSWKVEKVTYILKQYRETFQNWYCVYHHYPTSYYINMWFLPQDCTVLINYNAHVYEVNSIHLYSHYALYCVIPYSTIDKVVTNVLRYTVQGWGNNVRMKGRDAK